MTTNRIRVEFLLGLGLLAAVASSCAGASAHVRADGSKYPISMSPVVRDQSGMLLEHGHLVTVGQLSISSAKVAILYTLLLPRTFDVSDEVNRQVAAVGGEAVVNFTVETTDACDILNFFPLLNILPIWPGCVPVAVWGDIVKRVPLASSPPAAGPGNPPTQ
ncbi:MAG TPA: hypothetical protein VJ860_23545 [Polyangia bacterium]|jgi:hypothetical protein|nr:hypothetical protein [Polyangia bacterium]